MEIHMKIAIPTAESKTQYYINTAYVNFVKEAGLEPVLITYDNNVESVVGMCDGLLIPGGIDVDPIYYGENNLASFATDIKKDKFERELFWSFVINEKPVFGICRGYQLIVREFLNYSGNCDLDGYNRFRFTQHVPGHSLAKDREVPRTQPTHWVMADEVLYNTNNGIEPIPVNSMHHQGLLCEFSNHNQDMGLDVGASFCNNTFKILAVSDFSIPNKFDGYIVEAIDISGWIGTHTRIRGVQWHPEELSVTNKNETDLLTNFFLNNDEAMEAY